MNAWPLSTSERFPSRFDVFLNCAAKSANGGCADHFGDLLNTLKIARRGDGKTRFNDINSQFLQCQGQLDLFFGVQLTSGHLLPVPESGVENENFLILHKIY